MLFLFEYYIILTKMYLCAKNTSTHIFRFSIKKIKKPATMLDI